MKFFILKNNKTHGPFTKSQIENGLIYRKLTGEELVSEKPTGPWEKMPHLLSDLFPDHVETEPLSADTYESDIDSTDIHQATQSTLAEPVEEVPPVPETISCPDCDESVSVQAETCPHCGCPMDDQVVPPVETETGHQPKSRNLDDSRQPPQSTHAKPVEDPFDRWGNPIPPVPETTDCPDCDGSVSVDAETCPHCGCPMERPKKPTAKHEGPIGTIDESLNGRHQNWNEDTWGCVIWVALLAALLIVLLYLFSSWAVFY